MQGRLEPYTIGGEQMGPTRVWLADKDTPGLSMTRAFGDTVASSVGVIAQPHVMEIALEPEHQYLVLCSDGIYEFMSNDEIVGIVHAEAEKGALPAQIAKLLVSTICVSCPLIISLLVPFPMSISLADKTLLGSSQCQELRLKIIVKDHWRYNECHSVQRQLLLHWQEDGL